MSGAPSLDEGTADNVVTHSRTWSQGGDPRLAVVVSSYRRPQLLPGLVAALEGQTLDRSEFEVVLVDNGSADHTWSYLESLAARSPLRLLVARLPVNRGPAGGRNHGVGLVRAPVVVFTDDDCLPAPGWLEAMTTAFARGADVVQGEVRAEPGGAATLGPWGHTIWVLAPTPFFEACNVAYRRAAFVDAGGFDESDPVMPQASGRGGGEDACLGWRVQERGGQAVFAAEAGVYHRCIPGTFRHWLSEQRYLSSFPALARRSPIVAEDFWGGLFLSRQTAAFDLAVLSAAAATTTRRPALFLGAVPWVAARWPEARRRSHGDRVVGLFCLGQLAISDLVGLASLVEGSVRHRRPVL